VPGLDAVYIGPNDLALGCGYGRATYRDSVEVEQLIQGLVDTCRAAGVVAGLHCSDAEMVAHWARRGARMLTAGHDTTIVRQAVDGARTDVPEALGGVVTG
jgi:4-hydroxy-2-oxoheptanedioate aldolase